MYPLPTLTRLANHSLLGVYAAVLPARWTPPMLDVTASTCLTPAATLSNAHLDLKKYNHQSIICAGVHMLICMSVVAAATYNRGIYFRCTYCCPHACMYVRRQNYHAPRTRFNQEINYFVHAVVHHVRSYTFPCLSCTPENSSPF